MIKKDVARYIPYLEKLKGAENNQTMEAAPVSDSIQ
jgi:hypothetical protein